MRNPATESELPTEWSFVPAGLLAIVALVLSLAWPLSMDASGYDESSTWSLWLFGLHLLALAGCLRGSLRFLWRQRGQPSARARTLAWYCLVLTAAGSVAWGLFFATAAWLAHGS